jgi:hypothetical protein
LTQWTASAEYWNKEEAMKSIVSALVTLVLLGLAGLAFAGEDRVERVLREARELQARQDAAAKANAEWLRSPEGQAWLKAQSRGPQESTYSSDVGRIRLANPWGEAVAQCRSDVGGDFDAFAPVPGRITMVGTARERFSFSECMAGLGFPLESK